MAGFDPSIEAPSGKTIGTVVLRQAGNILR